ncbi:hypothetical protein VA596_47145 [Amycolatopsis sp., V23-08]|uniref:Ig-like domain repeat protein n=1 Tax=Amycolatopsis heterodermiae TaxID=3110235 RepID=A0ABU5RN02_9PSEU|nr:hypothetical protein [Amycolatopsis sp., V23-08]MEA5367175.1 hypothetical protein [Amycolatopsis sp., V23-08]
MAPVASAVPALPTGHHYLIDLATGEATDTATGEVLKPATAESLLTGKVAQGGPAGSTLTMSGATGQVSEASPATVTIRPIPATTCASSSIYFKVWRGVPYAHLCWADSGTTGTNAPGSYQFTTGNYTGAVAYTLSGGGTAFSPVLGPGSTGTFTGTVTVTSVSIQ